MSTFIRGKFEEFVDVLHYSSRQNAFLNRSNYKEIWNDVSRDEDHAKKAVSGSTDEESHRVSGEYTKQMILNLVGVSPNYGFGNRRWSWSSRRRPRPHLQGMDRRRCFREYARPHEEPLSKIPKCPNSCYEWIRPCADTVGINRRRILHSSLYAFGRMGALFLHQGRL
jgi:hypothetical protein